MSFRVKPLCMRHSILFILALSVCCTVNNLFAVNISPQNEEYFVQLINHGLKKDCIEEIIPTRQNQNTLQAVTTNQVQKHNSRLSEKKVNANERSDSEYANKRGLFSVIFGVAGFSLLYFPGPLAIIGVLFAVTGFILGIIGLRKDKNKTLALIGTIVGGLTLIVTGLAVYGNTLL